jgi:hypothetical protein
VPYHLHHFDAQGFEALARRHGYRVLRRRTITPNLWTILQLHALRQLPELGMPNTSWDASGAIEETNTRLALPYKTTRRVLGPIFRRIKTTGLVLMNRMIDLAGYGDSVLIELGIED